MDMSTEALCFDFTIVPLAGEVIVPRVLRVVVVLTARMVSFEVNIFTEARVIVGVALKPVSYAIDVWTGVNFDMLVVTHGIAIVSSRVDSNIWATAMAASESISMLA